MLNNIRQTGRRLIAATGLLIGSAYIATPMALAADTPPASKPSYNNPLAQLGLSALSVVLGLGVIACIYFAITAAVSLVRNHRAGIEGHHGRDLGQLGLAIVVGGMLSVGTVFILSLMSWTAGFFS